MATELDLTDYTVPDVELFLTRFPMFSPVDQGLVQMALLEAGTHVDTCWSPQDYQMAILYLTAHLLLSDGEPSRSSPTSGAVSASASCGTVTSKTVGDVTTVYKNTTETADTSVSPDAAAYERTSYGRSYLQLRRRNRTSPRVVGGMGRRSPRMPRC